MKICLKCKRNLFDKDNQCDRCGCTDIMDKKEYDILCSKFESATDKEKQQLRESKEYGNICKYKFTVDPKNTFEKRNEQSKRDKALYNQRVKQCNQEIEERRERVRKKQAEQVRIEEEQNTVTCPYCKSTNVSKIGTLNRIASVGLFGLASKKIGKQWHCNHCKSDF